MIPNAASARLAIALVRFAMAAATIAAVAVTFASSWGQWQRAGYPDRATLVVNFFSYFTIDSNVAAAIILAAGGVLILVTRGRAARGMTLLRAAVTVYMVITGVVYNVLLRGIPVTGGGDGVAWTNEVLHVVGPLVVLLDWLLAPDRVAIRWSRLPVLLAFPLVWVAYTLVRGPHVVDQVRSRDHWYPYPFLDPAQVGGYGGVAIYVVVIALAFAAVSLGIIATSRHGARRPSRP